MNIGIFTYGTRGDVQPYIALALGLQERGHNVMLAAPENFKDLIEAFGVTFHPLYGNAEEMMNSDGGHRVLKSENTIKLMKFFFKELYNIREPLRKTYWEGISKVDELIVNAVTLPIVSAIAEKQNKKFALTYFMPPVVPTGEFPLSDFDFLNFRWYNKLTYKIAHSFYWSFVKKETNEYRKQLGLPVLTENLVKVVERNKPLDLFCISPLLIPQPLDWESHHKITGFLSVPARDRKESGADDHPEGLNAWLKNGDKPIYMGFGSNGVGNGNKMVLLLNQLLANTPERILFCTGWAVYDDLPVHQNLFVTKYVNHSAIFPLCKLGIFHGGAGTLAEMLRNNLPVIIISFYTDQPAWGKIIERMSLGMHIPLKKLTAVRLITAIKAVQAGLFMQRVNETGAKLRSEKGLENAVAEIERYFA